MQGLWRSTSVNTKEGLSEGTDGAQFVILGSFCDHKKTMQNAQSKTYIMKVI